MAFRKLLFQFPSPKVRLMHCPGKSRDGHCGMLARRFTKVATGLAAVKWPFPERYTLNTH